MKSIVTHIIASVCLAMICSALLLGDASWQEEGVFDPITLPDITTQDAIVDGFSIRFLDLTEDVEISADNSARLTKGSSYLITEYKLTFDGDGSSTTGGPMVDWTDYSTFLVPAAVVMWVADDNDVEVTLHVRARNDADEVANAGEYIATQTLTATWAGE